MSHSEQPRTIETLASSTRRTSPGGWVDQPRTGPDGRYLCRRCGGSIAPGRRRTFCSKECVHEWKLRTNAGYLRLKTFERDKGVCAECGVNTVEAVRRPHARNTGHLWQADHIKPVVEGGGECGLDNIRTLCTGCHKKATAELRRRIAESRRTAPLFESASAGGAA